MADNVELDSGTGGAIIAADDISSVWYQINKLAFGPLNTATLVTASVGLPVDIKASVALTLTGDALTALQLIDNPVAILGTATYLEATTSGMVAGAVRNDVLAPLADTDNEIAPLQVDDLGALWTHETPNLVDAGNSRTATLLSGATFTGTGVDVLGFGAITIMVDASHNSATDGMTFQFSTDNTNWDDVYLFTYTAADGARRFQFATTGEFFRVVYTNGGTGQSHFRIQTILHHVLEPITSIHRLVDNVDPDRSTTLVKAAIIAQAAGSGDFVPVQASAAGNLKISIEEFSDGVDVGNGAVGSETLRVTIASDSTGVIALTGNALTALQLIDDVVYAEDVSSQAADPGMAVYAIRDDALTANAGVNADGDYMPFRATNFGALWTQPTVNSVGGCKMFTSVDLDESEEDITTGPTTIYGIYVWNATAAPLWLQLFNTNTVTVGTTAPDNNFLIPANADSDGAGVVIPIPVAGLAYSVALTVAITTASGTTNGAPAADAAGIVVMYQD